MNQNWIKTVERFLVAVWIFLIIIGHEHNLSLWNHKNHFEISKVVDLSKNVKFLNEHFHHDIICKWISNRITTYVLDYWSIIVYWTWNTTLKMLFLYSFDSYFIQPWFIFHTTLIHILYSFDSYFIQLWFIFYTTLIHISYSLDSYFLHFTFSTKNLIRKIKWKPF